MTTEIDAAELATELTVAWLGSGPIDMSVAI
jgi:hypothetical protein